MINWHKFSDKRIAIVGFGYIGKHLHSTLIKKSEGLNFSVSIYTRSNMKSIIGETFDYVFNCAGNTGNFRVQILETIDSNLSLHIFLLQNVNIIDTFITISSTRIYGFSEDDKIISIEGDIISENESHLDVNYIYDGAKKLMESMLINYSKVNSSFKIIICRFSNVFGSFELNDLDGSTYLKFLIKSSISKGHITLNQNQNSTKGYIHVNDAIDGLLRSALNSLESDIFNICSGASYSIKDWLDFLDISYLIPPTKIKATYSKNSIEKAKKTLNFKPKYFLENLNLNQIIKIA